MRTHQNTHTSYLSIPWKQVQKENRLSVKKAWIAKNLAFFLNLRMMNPFTPKSINTCLKIRDVFSVSNLYIITTSFCRGDETQPSEKCPVLHSNYNPFQNNCANSNDSVCWHFARRCCKVEVIPDVYIPPPHLTTECLALEGQRCN